MLKKINKDKITLMIFLVPAIVMLIGVSLVPTIYLVNTSFTSWELSDIYSRVYIGFSNYVELMRDSRFWHSLGLAFYFMGGTTSLQLLIGLILAILLNMKLRGIQLLRSVSVIPMVLPPVVVGMIWWILYSPTVGPIHYYINTILLPFGLRMKPVLAIKQTAMLGVIASDVWEWTPFITLTLLAALQSLPREPYESALIDGASKFQVFGYITLPMLKPAILLVLLLRAMESMKVFPKIYVMTAGGPGKATETVNYYAFLKGLTYLEVGYSSAMVVIMFVIIIIFSIILSRFLSRQIMIG